MTVSNVFAASSLSMSNGGRMVKVTLWPVCFSNSAAMAFAAICVDPTLSTRTSAAVARVDEAMSVSALTAIVRKDRRMMSSRNDAVVIVRESTPERRPSATRSPRRHEQPSLVFYRAALAVLRLTGLDQGDNILD